MTSTGRPSHTGAFRWTVVCVVAFVVAGALFGAWRFWAAGWLASNQASSTGRGFLSACAANQAPAPATTPTLRVTGTPPSDGTTIGLITLPGSTTAWPIKAGTGSDALAAGVGWYTQTAAPGQLGNMAVVGRRLPSGGAFDAILSLSAGDQIELQTCAVTYTYTVRIAPRDLTVQSADTWVLDPVPGAAADLPTTAWLTLIANLDVMGGPDRAVGFAELTDAVPRS